MIILLLVLSEEMLFICILSFTTCGRGKRDTLDWTFGPVVLQLTRCCLQEYAMLMDEETFLIHMLKRGKTCCGRERSAEHIENRETLNTLKNEGWQLDWKVVNPHV